MSQSITYGVIGTGKLGLSLIKKLHHSGDLTWVVARSDDSQNRVKHNAPNCIIYSSVNEISTQVDVIFICTNDKSLASVVEDLSVNYEINHPKTVFIHCSGAYDTSIFNPLIDSGANCAACHPYQTFFSESEEAFDNISWSIDCTDELYFQIKLIITSLGGIPYRIYNNQINKPLYHLSAVAASNLMTAAIQLAKMIAVKASIAPEQFMPQILKTTLDNNIRALQENTFPLTGPVAREEIEIIKKHLEELESSAELRNAYLNMIRAATEIAYSNNLVKEGFYNDIISLQ